MAVIAPNGRPEILPDVPRALIDPAPVPREGAAEGAAPAPPRMVGGSNAEGPRPTRDYLGGRWARGRVNRKDVIGRCNRNR